MVNEIVLVQPLPHLHAVNLEDAAVIGLNEHTDGVFAQRLRQHTRRGAYTALKAEADGACSSAHVALLHRAAMRLADGVDNHLGRDVQAANVVQTAIIGLTHNCIHRADTLVARLHQRITHEALDTCCHAQRVGENDRRLNVTQFTHLRHARQLAKPIAHIDGGGHLMAEDVALVRHNSRDTRTHAIALDKRHMAYRHPWHIGDSVILSCFKNSCRESPFAQRLVLLSHDCRRPQHHTYHKKQISLHHHSV